MSKEIYHQRTPESKPTSLERVKKIGKTILAGGLIWVVTAGVFAGLEHVDKNISKSAIENSKVEGNILSVEIPKGTNERSFPGIQDSDGSNIVGQTDKLTVVKADGNILVYHNKNQYGSNPNGTDWLGIPAEDLGIKSTNSEDIVWVADTEAVKVEKDNTR